MNSDDELWIDIPYFALLESYVLGDVLTTVWISVSTAYESLHDILHCLSSRNMWTRFSFERGNSVRSWINA